MRSRSALALFYNAASNSMGRTSRVIVSPGGQSGGMGVTWVCVTKRLRTGTKRSMLWINSWKFLATPWHVILLGLMVMPPSPFHPNYQILLKQQHYQFLAKYPPKVIVLQPHLHSFRNPLVHDCFMSQNTWYLIHSFCFCNTVILSRILITCGTEVLWRDILHFLFSCPGFSYVP